MKVYGEILIQNVEDDKYIEVKSKKENNIKWMKLDFLVTKW